VYVIARGNLKKIAHDMPHQLPIPSKTPFIVLASVGGRRQAAAATTLPCFILGLIRRAAGQAV